MSIEQRLTSFIQSMHPGAIILQGTWGRGKTHLWRSLTEAEANRTESALGQYAYVSLFGINSIDELKVAIYLNAAERNGWKSEEAESEKGWWQKGKQKRKAVGKFISETTSVPHLTSLGKIFNAYAFHNVRNMLICLDDIERRGGSLSLKEVLGLVSMLWEERSCRVVVVLNNQALGADQVVWDENREKVFQDEVVFEPTAEVCANLVFGNNPEGLTMNAARHALLTLELTNVRIIARVKDTLTRLLAVLNGLALSEYTLQRLAHDAVWGVYCLNGRGEGAPPLEEEGLISRIVAQMHGPDTRTEEQTRWDTLRDRYRPNSEAPFDRSIYADIERGYSEVDLLRAEALAFDQAVVSDQAARRFGDVWDEFHDVLTDNRTAIVDGFRERFDGAVGAISSNTLDATAWLLRQLGEDALANDFIARWIETRRGARSNELSPREIFKFQQLNDQAFADAITAANVEGNYLPPLHQAFQNIGTNGGNFEDSLQAIANTTPETLAEYLEAHRGSAHVKTVRTVVSLAAVPPYPQYSGARDAVIGALRIIARKSAFNRFRITHSYKIEPAVLDADQGSE